MRPVSDLAPALRLELRLRTTDGDDWVLSLSPGMERFVGAYPRLDGIDPGGPLLVFQPVAAGR